MFAGFVLATVIANVAYCLKCVYGWTPRCLVPQSVKDLQQDTAAVEQVRAKFNTLKVDQHQPLPSKDDVTATTFENSVVVVELAGKQAIQMQTEQVNVHTTNDDMCIKKELRVSARMSAL